MGRVEGPGQVWPHILRGRGRGKGGGARQVWPHSLGEGGGRRRRRVEGPVFAGHISKGHKFRLPLPPLPYLTAHPMPSC